MQKHLAHELKTWNSEMQFEQNMHQKKQLNLILNDQRVAVKEQVQDRLRTSKSVIGGIVIAQKSLLDASLELESIK